MDNLKNQQLTIQQDKYAIWQFIQVVKGLLVIKPSFKDVCLKNFKKYWAMNYNHLSIKWLPEVNLQRVQEHLSLSIIKVKLLKLKLILLQDQELTQTRSEERRVGKEET